MSSICSSKELATLKWTISNFTDGECENLVLFPTKKEIKFHPSCNPNYYIWGSKYVFMYLYMDKSNKDPLNVRYRVSILNANGDKCETHERMANFSEKSNRRYDGAFLWKQEYLSDPTSGLLVNGKLITYWEIEEIDTVPETDSGPKTQYDHNRMSKDYQSLLESGQMSDAVLVVGDKKLPVHKLILSTRSPVFAAMFAHSSTKEAQENRVEITDIEVDVLEQVLKYIYFGAVESLEQFAAELLAAADKYQLDSLKTICEHFLCNTITTESVSELFVLADLHQATELYDKCADYIADNGTQVMASEGWKKIAAIPNDFMSNVMERMALKIAELKIENKNK